MSNPVGRLYIAALALAGGLVLALDDSTHTGFVDALPDTPTDVDADLLPDDVEWALMLDPTRADTDDDGTDDFLATVGHVYTNPFDDGEPVEPMAQFAQARVSKTSGAPAPDHAVRCVVSHRNDPDGSDALWLHMLFRFVGPDLPTLQVVDPWIDYLGVATSLSPLIATAPSELAFRDAGTDGLLVRFSFRVGSHSELLVLSPATIGATFMLDGEVFKSGVTLIDVNGKSVAFTPVSPTTSTLIRLDAVDDPFWSANRVCQIRLSVTASGGGGHLCTVTSARCRPAGNLRCPPTCTTSVGQTVYVPDGLSTINGGG